MLGLIVALGLAAGFGLGAAQAQTAPAPAAETTEALLSVAMAGYTLVPVLGDDGTQARDDQGQPVFQRRPLADSVVTPGDAILYVIRVENNTADPAKNLQIGAQVAPEVLFDPYSVSGPDVQALRMALEWADNLPAQLAYVTSGLAGWQAGSLSVAGNTLTLTGGELGAGQTASITIRARVR